MATEKKKPGRRINPDSKRQQDLRRQKYTKGVPREFAWHYKDPYMHSMHLPFLRSKAQANFREEDWQLTFEEFFDIWKDQWHNRGRDTENVCLTRIDPTGAWSLDNVEIITRLEFIRRQREISFFRKKQREENRPKKTKKNIVYKKMVQS